MNKRCKNCCLYWTDACNYRFLVYEDSDICERFIDEDELYWDILSPM